MERIGLHLANWSWYVKNIFRGQVRPLPLLPHLSSSFFRSFLIFNFSLFLFFLVSSFVFLFTGSSPCLIFSTSSLYFSPIILPPSSLFFFHLFFFHFFFLFLFFWFLLQLGTQFRDPIGLETTLTHACRLIVEIDRHSYRQKDIKGMKESNWWKRVVAVDKGGR